MSSTCKLTPRQAAFIPEFLATGNATASVIAAGFSVKGASVAGTRMLRNAKVAEALQARQSADATRLSIKRENVVAGLLEAVNQARAQSNPMAMIAGLRELGKMMGFYAPEVKKVDLNVSGQAVMNKMNALSDAELLKIITAGQAAAARGVRGTP